MTNFAPHANPTLHILVTPLASEKGTHCLFNCPTGPLFLPFLFVSLFSSFFYGEPYAFTDGEVSVYFGAQRIVDDWS